MYVHPRSSVCVHSKTSTLINTNKSVVLAYLRGEMFEVIILPNRTSELLFCTRTNLLNIPVTLKMFDLMGVCYCLITLN
jgi:hypothetical protein